jgi:hypothetical protein
VEEQLLPGSKDEISAAVDTLQNLVLEFHGVSLPSARKSQATDVASCLLPKDWTESPRSSCNFFGLGQSLGSALRCAARLGYSMTAALRRS